MGRLKTIFDMGKSVVKFALNNFGLLMSGANVAANAYSLVTQDPDLALLSASGLGVGVGITVSQMVNRYQSTQTKPKRKKGQVRKQEKGLAETGCLSPLLGAASAMGILAFDAALMVAPGAVASAGVLAGLCIAANYYDSRP